MRSTVLARVEMGITETAATEEEFFFNIGSFGIWQKIVYVAVFWGYMVDTLPSFAMTFLAPNTDFWCVEPNMNSSLAQNSTDLLMTNKNEACYVQKSNYSSSGRDSSVELHFEDSLKCTKWEYDTSRLSETLVSKWDLVCDREWLISLAKSVYMIGFMFSGAVFGQLSDCIGRLPAIVISYIIATTSLVLSLFSTSYLMFAVLRFFQAFGVTGLTTVGYVLLVEITGPDDRTSVSITSQLGNCAGLVILPGIAYLFPNWFWLLFAILAPTVLLASAYKFIPESPRWLLMQKDYDKLEKVLTTAAAMNKKELKCDVKNLINSMISQSSENRESSRKSVIDVFRTPNIRKRAFIMIYIWIVNAFLYYGISYNTNELAGNPYLNFFLSGIMELPSTIAAFLAIRRFGRRPVFAWLMVVCGAACVASIFVPQNLSWLATTLHLFGKFCATGTLTILYLYTSELFPTVVRNVAVGTCSMLGRVGSIAAPFVRELGIATHPSVPNILYFVLAVSSGLSTLLLPETKGCKIPDSIEEGEHLGEKEFGHKEVK
ncbi:organic cation transporter protein-like [Uloborus diversus]|uniref:organic cation transporter protein-like n=1 Tax=Uloborus diversus TaxID=327109 RepID=UPI00240A2D73|nr:organic cation transporter protein-like [Uloborus diversus]